MSFQEHKITEYAASIAALPDKIENRAEWLKKQFDARTDSEVKDKHNGLCDALEAETAAADIGAAAPEGVTAAPAGKLQAVLNGLRDLVKAHTDRADNPHGVTAAQAGAYSKAETDAAISAKVVELGAGDMAKSIYDPGNEQQPLLPRNGDGSNVTASFTEAEQDADIQTGEELTVLFGKIKKRFSTYDADGDGVVDRAAAADRVAKKFILQNNAGQQMAEFDGSADRTVQLTPGQVGAEPAFTKNNAFNKNFGSAAGTVCQGNDGRLSNARRASNILQQQQRPTVEQCVLQQ